MYVVTIISCLVRVVTVSWIPGTLVREIAHKCIRVLLPEEIVTGGNDHASLVCEALCYGGMIGFTFVSDLFIYYGAYLSVIINIGKRGEYDRNCHNK